MRRPGRLEVLGAALLVGTAILAWLVVRRRGSATPIAAQAAYAEAEAEQAPAARAVMAARSQRQTPEPPELRDRAASVGVDPLANYKKYAVYPPRSRPVTQRRADAFKYNHRVVQYLPVVANSGDKPSFYSAFTADKINVFEKERIKLTLTAAREPNSTSGGYPIDIADAGLVKGRSQNGPKVF